MISTIDEIFNEEIFHELITESGTPITEEQREVLLDKIRSNPWDAAVLLRILNVEKK